MDFCKKLKLTLIFLLGLFLFTYNCVYSYTFVSPYNTNINGFNNRRIYFKYNDNWYNWLLNNASQFINNDNYFYIIFSTSNNNNSHYYNYALFLEKSQVSGKPFNINLAQNSLPGNTTRKITTNSVGGSVYEFGQWQNNSPWSSNYTNQGDGNWDLEYIDNVSGELTYYIWSNNESTNYTIGGTVYNNIWVEPFSAPNINNWTSNDSTTPMTFTSVEDTAYIVVHRNSVPTNSTMILNCYDVTNGTNLVQEFELNQNSPFLSSDGTQYTIGLYVSNWFNTVSGNKYWFTLTYLDNTNNTQTLSYWFNLSYSSSTVENIQDNTQQDIKNSLENTENYLKNDNVDYNDIMTKFNDFEVAFSNPNDNYADNLFDILNQMFVSDTAHDFEFVIPNSNGQKIIIPANYIETHIPEIILVLVRIFYWYVISRYIIKDIWHIIDKLRQGDYFITNDKDIKTEIL